MTGPNGRPNLDPGACPARECERLCGPGELCKCPPCLCPLCSARRQQARARADTRGLLGLVTANAKARGGELDPDALLTLFDDHLDRPEPQ